MRSRKKKTNITTHSELVDKHFGKKGTASRAEYDKGFEYFKLGVMIKIARLEKGLTQEELADKCGTTKSYISKIENNIKEVRISTLERIVEIGLGGQLQLSIEL